MKSPVILIIGYGSIGSRRMQLLQELGAEVLVCDTDTRKAQAAVDAGAWIGFVTLNSAMNYKFDAALICTPPSSHLDIALRVAGAGCNLFIEKPLSNSLDKKKITQLIYKMQTNSLWGIMGQSYRFCPSLIEWRKQILDKPLLYGSINSGQHLNGWTPGRDYHSSIYASKENGGIVLSSLSHSLDQAQWLFGEIEAVAGLISNSGELGIEVDDDATLLLRMKSGTQVMVHNDFWQLPWRNEISAVTTGLDTEIQGNSTIWNMQHGDAEDMYQAEMEHLVKCVKLGYAGQPDIAQGILNLEFMEAAQKASNTGTWQRIGEFWKEVTGRK